jgi:hypothetical protein
VPQAWSPQQYHHGTRVATDVVNPDATVVNLTSSERGDTVRSCFGILLCLQKIVEASDDLASKLPTIFLEQ